MGEGSIGGCFIEHILLQNTVIVRYADDTVLIAIDCGEINTLYHTFVDSVRLYNSFKEKERKLNRRIEMDSMLENQENWNIIQRSI